MGIGTGLLALALLAAEGPSGPPGEPLSFRVRMMTVEGLGWRAEAYPRLQPVARLGTSTVWTTDRALVDDLVEAARWSVAAQSDGGSTAGKTETQLYIAHADRLADGPINAASAVSFKPELGRLDAGFLAKLSGRKLDQGTLARVEIEETYVNAIHTFGLKETLRGPKKIGVNFEPVPAKDGVQGLHLVQTTSTVQDTETETTVQVPEVVRTKVEGEWLIPSQGVLLVSLGVTTSADEQGKAIVIERLAVLEIVDRKGQGSAPASHAWLAPTPKGPFARAMPALPARGLPVAMDPAGQVVDLPPLPEALASTDFEEIKPEPNQPSPQTRPIVSQPAREARIAHAGFEPAARLPMPRSPDRSMPIAIDPSGQVVDIPPLPEAIASADLNRIRPEPNQPSPQAPTVDPEVARTGFVASTPAKCAVPASEGSGPDGLLFSFLKDFMADEELRKDYKLEFQFNPDGKSLRVTVKDGPVVGPEEAAEAPPFLRSPWLARLTRTLNRIGLILEVDFDSPESWVVIFGRDPEMDGESQEDDGQEVTRRTVADPGLPFSNDHCDSFVAKLFSRGWMAAYSIVMQSESDGESVRITIKDGPTCDEERRSFSSASLEGIKSAPILKGDVQVEPSAFFEDETAPCLRSPIFSFLKALSDHNKILKDFAIDPTCEPDGKSCRITIKNGPGGAGFEDAAACSATSDLPPALKVLAWAMSQIGPGSNGEDEGFDFDLVIGQEKAESGTLKGKREGVISLPPAGVSMGMNVKDARRTRALDGAGDLSAALKNPGRPETIYFPLGGNLSLEVRATVVPTPKP